MLREYFTEQETIGAGEKIMAMQMQRIQALGCCGLTALAFMAGPAGAEDAKSKYPEMAPAAQYRIADAAGEITLARSAAPASISGDAEIMTLGSSGYETAVKGKNGFVCLVQRSWGADFGDGEFWNPKIRSPICFNPASVRTVLPPYLERTQWVLAGVAKSEMIARIKAQLKANTFVLPEPGAMSFMMSKQQYLNDQAGGHWHPHLMFFAANTNAAAWGAGFDHSPVFAAQSDPEPITTFFVPVRKWSDDSPDEAAH
jgi:hypothetical protein